MSNYYFVKDLSDHSPIVAHDDWDIALQQLPEMEKLHGRALYLVPVERPIVNEIEGGDRKSPAILDISDRNI